MNHPGKVFLTLTAALLLLCPQIFAQEPSGEAAPPPAEQTDQDEDTNQLLQQFEKAPTLEGGTQKLYHIRNVNIHGAQYIDNSILRASSGLIPGDSIYLPSNFIANAISRLWNQRLFSDIRVGATIEGDSLDLEVFLKERPRVNYWRFEGISKSNQKDLLEKLKLKRGTELSDYVIDKNSKLIHKYYADKGFRNAEVSVRIDNDSILKQAVNVTFIVDRKRKIKIGEINFTGNEEFSDKRLRRTFKKTHQKSLNFFRGAKFNEEDFENDKELLLDFYNSKGFRNANIVADSIYAINDKRMGITLDISEGNKYYIRNVSWIGNSVYETDELARMFGVEKGSIYDKKSMYKRLGIGAYYNPDEPSITNLYKDQGYLTSQIDPAEIIIGKDSIDLEVRVFEGKQFTINNVGISGNMRLDDEVIRRELYTRPGELREFDPRTGEDVLLKRANVLGSFDARDYVERRIWVQVRDGEQVPVSLVWRRDCVRGRMPMFVIGYGSYEISSDPAFSVSRLSMLDRGVLYVVPHVRGGGEMGRAWYEMGRRRNKKHTFEDFIDVTAAIQDCGLADRARTVANGGSAGGLLMGAVANMAPERFAGIEADVPFVDALTTILDPTLPLTVTEWDEWGDPLHDAETYRYMKTYTPYENAPAPGEGGARWPDGTPVTAFPKIFVTTSMNDSRVMVVEPLKWVARLQAAGLDAIIKIEAEAGHGGTSGRYAQWKQICYENAWVLAAMGIEE